jgi:hypothetical protein
LHANSTGLTKLIFFWELLRRLIADSSALTLTLSQGERGFMGLSGSLVSFTGENILCVLKPFLGVLCGNVVQVFELTV